MKLAWLAAAWIAGIAGYAALGLRAWPLAVALALSVAAIAVVRRDARTAVPALVLPVLFLGALARAETARPRTADDAAARFNDGVAMRMRGVLRDDPDLRDTSQRFAVSVRSVEIGGAWRNASGGVLVRTALLPRHHAGDVVEFEGALESPPQLDGFDYGEYLARRDIQSVAEYPRLRVIGHDEPPWYRARILAARRALSGGLDRALPEPHSSLAKGVLLGERSALPPDVLDHLNVTNTSHLVVVSGSNIVLVSSYATLALAWLFGRRRALWLSIAVVLAYAGLVGFSPPVARATIMGVLLVLAQLSGRRSDGFTSIAIAGALMSAHDPAVVRDVSFQLSFASTAGIVWLSSPLRRRLLDGMGWLARRDELPRWTGTALAEPLAVTLAAMAATTPLLALNFGRLSLVAIPANLLVVPLFPLILAASTLAAIGGIIPHAHLALAAPAYVALTYWMRVAAWFAGAPAASVAAPSDSMLLAAGAYGTMALALAVVARRMGLPSRVELGAPATLAAGPLRRLAAITLPAALLAGSLGFVARPHPAPSLSVTIMDVGQGDAILIETPAGHDILVDGGPGAAVVRGLGKEMPWHDRSIDAVIATHTQADHATGLLAVLDRYDVRRIIAGPHDGTSLVARELAASVRRHQIPYTVARAGTAVELGDGVTLEVLAPTAAAAPRANPNDDALVLRLSWRDVSFLFASDIEAAGEQALLESGVPLASTVLKVAHHGSATSTSRGFVDAVRPAVAVVSSGADNRFGHPDAGVLRRLQRYAATYNTAERGSVRLRTDGHRLQVRTER